MTEILQKAMGGWTLKVKEPLERDTPTLLLIHGWTGDENSMWVFASQLEKDFMIVAPRAPFISHHSEYEGYSWINREQLTGWPTKDDFLAGVQALSELIDQLTVHYPTADFGRMNLVGFSEGAALAASFTFQSPASVNRLAMLAGFLPEGLEIDTATQPLEGIRAFVGHGTQDERVPVALARNAVIQLRLAGAHVSACESPVGHKLGANCLRELRQFLDGAEGAD